MDISKEVGKIILLSGESEFGNFEIYKGKRTNKALLKHVKQEECNGDRWVQIYFKDDKSFINSDLYFQLDPETLQYLSGEQRLIPDELIEN